MSRADRMPRRSVRHARLSPTVFGLLVAALAAAPPSVAQTTCEADLPDPPSPEPTTITIQIDRPLAGELILGLDPDCRLTVGGAASAVGIPVLLDVYLVIDRSGSTGGTSGVDIDGNGSIGGSGDSILAAEVAAARILVDRLDPSFARVAVISFSSGAATHVGLTDSHGAVQSALDGVFTAGPSGSTNYTAALELLISERMGNGDPSRTQLGIFLSDGRPTSPGAEAIVKAGELAALDVILHTFGVGVGADPDILTSMANATGGQFSQVLVPGEIVVALSEFAIAGIRHVVVLNPATGESVTTVPLPDGRFEAQLAAASGPITVVVTAVADTPAAPSLSCQVEAVAACISTSCAEPRTVPCGTDGAEVTDLVATASDPIVSIINDSPYDATPPAADGDASGFYPPGTTVVTFQFVTSFAFSECTVTVVVVDDLPPAIVSGGEDMSFPCGAPLPGAIGVEAVDDCDSTPDATFTSVVEAGPCAGAFDVVRTWVVVDDVGNSATHVQRITFTDDVPPEILGVPGDAVAECGAVPAPDVTAADGCDGSPTLVLDVAVDAGPCPSSQALVRTWTATDDCGNSSVAQQRIDVLDTTPPALQGVPASATVPCAAVPGAPVVTAVDACDGAPDLDVEETVAEGDCPGRFTLTRTWTATDDCGNATSATQVLEVVDIVSPALQGVPADGTVECDAVPTPPVVTALDACDAEPDVVLAETVALGDCTGRFTLTRTWTATDDCGNAASATQVLQVVDTVPPALQGVPADGTVECDAVPTPPVVTALDACDAEPDVVLAETIVLGDCTGRFTVHRTWTATDDCGNAASATQVLQVVDTVPPALQGVPADGTVECDAVPAPAPVAALDACDGEPDIVLAETVEEGDCPGRFTLARTWTATDDCGNAASATQVLHVVDTTPPVVAANPADDRCLWPPSHSYSCFTAADFAPAVADACSGPVAWTFSGCASDQPDDAPGDGMPNGDGSFDDDCVLAPDGSAFCVRSERAGGGRAGRSYAITIVAVDACGNAAAAGIATIRVEHDRRRGTDCVDVHGGLAHDSPPF